jgi:phosphohistidine swiveling domain-containing protein
MATRADLKLFKKYLKRDWYVQGFSAVPLFLSTAAMSGTIMKKYLGFGYRHFLFNYRGAYGEMAYDRQDFKTIWRLVKKKLSADPGYLKKIKSLYYQNLRRYQPLARKIRRSGIEKWPNQEIIKIFQGLIWAQVDGVGVAHIIDAIGIEIEEEFKARLRRELPVVSPAEFNEIFTALITPSRISFVNREEKELLAIRGGIKNKAALERHAAKYFWLQNSYAGPKFLTARDFSEKLRDLKKREGAYQKRRPPRFRYKFSPDLRRTIKIIDFCAVWQDERKSLLFKNIADAGRVVQEIARRLEQPAELLYYLGLSEATGIKSLDDLRAQARLLRERRQGCLMLIKGLSDMIISGADYRRLMGERSSLLKDRGLDSRELHGTVANMGTAKGKVSIIKNLESLRHFQRGNILVASMTRPEYMLAIKQAAAIITDEGGLTCHAAIIARELNIPAVIGTKIATQVLKTGMTVEVDADKGIVKILKKA